jgi:hypothetical protein
MIAPGFRVHLPSAGWKTQSFAESRAHRPGHPVEGTPYEVDVRPRLVQLICAQCTASGIQHPLSPCCRRWASGLDVTVSAVLREPGLVVSMRLVTEPFPGARASWLGGSLVRGGYRDDITVLTHDSGRHPAHQTGASAGRRPDRRAAGSAAPGAVLDRLRLRARPVLQPRPTPPPRPPARAAPGRAPADPANGAPSCWCRRLASDRSASRAP